MGYQARSITLTLVRIAGTSTGLADLSMLYLRESDPSDDPEYDQRYQVQFSD
jgi:hypothetical protein